MCSAGMYAGTHLNSTPAHAACLTRVLISRQVKQWFACPLHPNAHFTLLQHTACVRWHGAHMCLMKGSCSSTVATRPFMGAGTCVSGSPHSGNDSQLPILPRACAQGEILGESPHMRPR